MLYICLQVAMNVESSNTHQDYFTVDSGVCKVDITGTTFIETYSV